MTLAAPTYCTREEAKAALDITETARADSRVDRAIESATGAVDGCLRRRFTPWTGTRYFDWPARPASTAWRLWLNQHDLISVTSLVSGGTTISSADYFLRPDHGPPFTHVEIDLASQAGFSTGSTHQRAIAITGVFGYSDDSAPAGTLAEALDDSETGIDVSNSVAIGVGSLIKVDSERMLVTGKSMLTTGQTASATASTSVVTLAVSDGTAFNMGETILLDSERMLIVDIAGNNLTVKRAFDGTVLAAHTTATIYAPRTLTVVRGAEGTTAATHLTSTAITVHRPPPLVRDLAIAYALNQLLQESAGYARVAGSGDNQRELTGRGIDAIERDALERYGRQLLIGAV